MPRIPTSTRYHSLLTDYCDSGKQISSKKIVGTLHLNLSLSLIDNKEIAEKNCLLNYLGGLFFDTKWC